MAFGINIDYPITKGSDGFFKKTYSNVDAIRSKVNILFRTMPGERPFSPEFGLGLHKYLFSPSTMELEEFIRLEIERKIKKYVPEIVLNNLEIERYENELNIKVSYYLKANSTLQETIEITVK